MEKAEKNQKGLRELKFFLSKRISVDDRITYSMFVNGTNQTVVLHYDDNLTTLSPGSISNQDYVINALWRALYSLLNLNVILDKDKQVKYKLYFNNEYCASGAIMTKQESRNYVRDGEHAYIPFDGREMLIFIKAFLKVDTNFNKK